MTSTYFEGLAAAGTVLAVIVAITYGFTAVTTAALVVYGLGVLSLGAALRPEATLRVE